MRKEIEMAENIGFFLTDQGVPLDGKWEGSLTAKEQRKYFGTYMGRGTIIVNGWDETVTRCVTVGFGACVLYVAQIDAKKLSRSYHDIIRGHQPSKDFQHFLDSVGGNITCDEIEHEVN